MSTPTCGRCRRWGSPHSRVRLNQNRYSPKPASQPAPLDLAVAPNMPAAIQNFQGLAFNGTCTGGSCGAGWPPDTADDVGPDHFVEAGNTSIGVYSKAETQLTALTFNSLWSAAATGTACYVNNQGDVTVLYDSIGDRWIVADFGFTSISTPPFYECIAVSKTGDPVSGGWYLYPLRVDDASHPWFNDYPKMGLWPDAIYMTANEFQGSTFEGARIWALNRTELESGTLNGQVVDTSSSIYSLLPANLRGALPPANTPEYLAVEDASSFYFPGCSPKTPTPTELPYRLYMPLLMKDASP
jgi:hypothetical protein